MPPTAPLKLKVLKEKLTSSLVGFTLSSYPEISAWVLKPARPGSDEFLAHSYFLSMTIFHLLSFKPLPSPSLPHFPLVTLPSISQTPTQSRMKRTSMDHHHLIHPWLHLHTLTLLSLLFLLSPTSTLENSRTQSFQLSIYINFFGDVIHLKNHPYASS